MKKFLVLIMFLFLALQTAKSQFCELDPNILWVSDSTMGYFDGFAVHPNGNVLAYKYSVVTELDGNTGKFVRKFPVFTTKNKIDMIKVSPDGKYIISSYDEVNIVNYETGDLVKRFPIAVTFDIFPDSKRIIGINYFEGSLDSLLFIYDIEKDKVEYYKQFDFYPKLTLSPDGKYFATGISRLFTDGTTSKYYTVLKLWDTETHTEIKTLGKYEGNNDVNSIKFSPDGKYVGFQVYFVNLYIYNTSDFSLYKHYDEKNISIGVSGFDFISNSILAIYGFQIMNLINDKQIFTTTINNGPYPFIEYNTFNNSLVVACGKIYAYDLNKIMTTVKDNNTEQNFSVNYENEILSLNNIQAVTNSLKISILDINGKIIRQIEQLTTNGKIEIPIKLTNGTYILSIKDGEKEYSSKFMVVE